MKKIIVLLIVVLGLVALICGCTTQAPDKTQTLPTVPSTFITATASPQPTEVILTTTMKVEQTSTIPTTVTTTKTAYSSIDINRHFIDITFGPDYAVISKWQKPLVSVGINGDYKDNDVKILNDFFKQFNSYSSDSKIVSEVKKGTDNADVVLKLIPESALKQMEPDKSWKVSKDRDTGTIWYVYKTTHYIGTSTDFMYINSELKGDERTHWILRALLYELGFAGETGNYPDSFFYSDTTTSTSLSKIDWKAVELMYGKIITIGQTLQDVQKVLLISNK